jgi:hypothetical protein
VEFITIGRHACEYLVLEAGHGAMGLVNNSIEPLKELCIYLRVRDRQMLNSDPRFSSKLQYHQILHPVHKFWFATHDGRELLVCLCEVRRYIQSSGKPFVISAFE